MNIVGFTKNSMIDYDGYISSVVFLQNCNFKCPYCHNYQIVTDKNPNLVDVDIVLSYLLENKGLIDALVISGGEPTLDKDLYKFIKIVKNEGFRVKLDTNGTNPLILKRLIDENLIDRVDMDIKHILDKEMYSFAVGLDSDKTDTLFSNILKSIDIIEKSDVDHVFRSTISMGLHTIEDIKEMQKRFKGLRLQNLNTKGIWDKKYILEPFSEVDFNSLVMDIDVKNIENEKPKVLKEENVNLFSGMDW